MGFSRRMSYLDAALFAMETPASHMHLAMVARFGPGGRPAEVAETLRRRIAEHPEGFNSLRLVAQPQLGGLVPPILVDIPGALELAYHIRDIDLQDGDARWSAGDDAALASWVEHDLGIGLDIRRPLWRISIVRGLVDGGFAVVFKGHHAVFDGVAALRLGLDVMENNPRQSERRRTRVAIGPRATVGSAIELAKWPVRVVRSIGLHLMRRHTDVNASEQKRPFTAPRRPLGGQIGPDRAIAHAVLSANAVGDIRRVGDCTVTDVLIALVSDALSRSLTSQSNLPRDPLVAMVPAAQSGAEWGRRAGNRLGFWFVSMETHETDLGDRLRQIAHSSHLSRVDLRMRGVDLWEQHAGAFFPGLFHKVFLALENKRIFRRLRPLSSIIIAHVVGPRDDLELCGARLEAIWPFGPITHGGVLSVTVVSVGDQLHVGVIADASLREIVHEVGTTLNDALDRLSRAVVADHVTAQM